MDLLSFIFPKTCVSCGRVGNYLREPCLNKVEFINTQTCPVCTKPAISGLTHPRCKTKLSLDGLHSFVYYYTPVPQALYRLKYKFVRDFAEGLTGKLARSLEGQFQGYFLSPVPLSKKRENWRGFNQVELLGELLASKLKLEFKVGILARKRDTKTQVGLSKKERARNVESAFECIDREFVKGKKFLLFDDVWTSGATLKNVGFILKRAGAESVWGLTLARSR